MIYGDSVMKKDNTMNYKESPTRVCPQCLGVGVTKKIVAILEYEGKEGYPTGETETIIEDCRLCEKTGKVDYMKYSVYTFNKCDFKYMSKSFPIVAKPLVNIKQILDEHNEKR
jgi:ribosomal protein L37AE/L43A